MAIRTIPDPIHGVTIDNASYANAKKIGLHRTALLQLPPMPTVRVVFDEGEQPSVYAAWVTEIQKIAYLMGELLDSESLASISVAAYKARTAAYLKAFPSLEAWEVINEGGGNWAGSLASQVAKALAAHDLVKAAGARSVFTLWENSWGPNHCGDGSAEPTPQQFSAMFPATKRAEADYVFLSWYPTQCTKVPNILVPAATVKAEVEALHALWPNAKIGFGEIGLPRPASATTVATARSIAAHYYRLGPQLALPYYVGGYFWWYGAQDIVPWPDQLGATIKAAMEAT